MACSGLRLSKGLTLSALGYGGTYGDWLLSVTLAILAGLDRNMIGAEQR